MSQKNSDNSLPELVVVAEGSPRKKWRTLFAQVPTTMPRWVELYRPFESSSEYLNDDYISVQGGVLWMAER